MRNSWLLGSSSSQRYMDNAQEPQRLKPDTTYTPASGENRCASCHCRLQRRTCCTMCDTPTYRCYSGRRPNTLLPSQNTVGKYKTGRLVPSSTSGPPGPPILMNVISCACRAESKTFKESNCSCHRVKLSCTVYCRCVAGDASCNPLTNKDNTMQ